MSPHFVDAFAKVGVFQQFGKLPVALSFPVVETQWMLPLLTANAAALEVPTLVVTAKFPVVQLLPSCTTIF